MADARSGEATGDSQPLLAESNILRRVVGGLKPTRTWRRWFSQDNAAEAESPAQALGDGHQAEAQRDIEAGGAAEQQWRPAASSASSSTAVPRPDMLDQRTEVSGASADAEPVQRLEQADADHSEITVAPLAAAEAGEVGAPAPEDHAAAVGADATVSSTSGLTLGERVASLGHLLGLGSRTLEGDTGSSGGKSPRGLKRFLTSSSSGEGAGPAARLSRSSSGSQPMCLICLEPLTSEDFLSGEAISLDCQCRGELALRHKACAIKWSRVKGDAVCDICKSPVANLPTPTPRAASTPSGSDVEITIEDYATHAGIPMGLDAVPGNADMLFDCIRVTWVFMIICILFFEMNLSTALWSGIIAGIGYTLFVRAMYRQQLAAAQVEAARVASGGVLPPPQPPPPMLHHVVG